jgi:hypothetical protein
VGVREPAETRVGIVYPWLGLVATITATIAVMFMVPDDYRPADALRQPALVMMFGLLIAPAAAAMRSIYSLIRIENLLAAAPIYWLLLDLIQGRFEIDDARKTDVIKAFAAIGLFSCGVWLAALQRPWRLPRFWQQVSGLELADAATFNAAVACFALGIFYFVYMAGFDLQKIISGLQQSRFDAPWSRDNPFGGWTAFVEHLAYFGMLLPALAVAVARLTGWFSLRALICYLMALIYALFQAQGGNRRYLGVMFGAALISWLLMSRDIGPRKIIWLALWASGLLYLMEVQYQYRGVGINAFSSPEQRQTLTRVEEIHVDDNFLRLAQSINYVPEQYPYVWYEYAFFALIKPIPRVLWHGKPETQSFRIQDVVNVGASLSSSVVGEFYVSGGLLMVLFGGWLYGRLGTWGTMLLIPPRTRTGTLLYGSWVMALFAGCRSMTDLVLMSYVFLALLAVLWMFRSHLVPPAKAFVTGRVTADQEGGTAPNR